MNGAQPFLVVLGIAQDGGVPQAGAHAHTAWRNPLLRRRAACLGIIDPVTNQRWMIEATPDFREQLYELDSRATQHATTPQRAPLLSGIAITHGHIGHYTGLIHLGREVMDTRGVPLYVLPRMAEFLSGNAPWEGLVRNANVQITILSPGIPQALNDRILLTPILVPHRDEYTETAAFIITGPTRRALFLPDIDSWHELDDRGISIEELLAEVDIAYLDATFYNRHELRNTDMSKIPHPTITESMERFAALPPAERSKIKFIHLNHTNPALDMASEAAQEIVANGFAVAVEGEEKIL